jgi:drug/metabolite transporter (DMT)-like permease
MGYGPMLYAGAMAINDAFNLSILKSIHLKWISPYFFILTVFLYAAQPFLFLQALSLEGIVIMNLLWDLLSSVIVTIVGCFFFKEEICTTKWAGILLSFVSIYLLG